MACVLAVAVGVTVACATTAIKEADVARRHNERKKRRLVPVVLFAATLCLKKKRLVPVEFRYAVTELLLGRPIPVRW